LICKSLQQDALRSWRRVIHEVKSHLAALSIPNPMFCRRSNGVEFHALGRHEPFRDAGSLVTIQFLCHGMDRDTPVFKLSGVA
jgi:hypothetical protein